MTNWRKMKIKLNNQSKSFGDRCKNISLEWKLRRLHYDMRNVLSKYPIPYLWLKKWQHDFGKVMFGIDTEIEGLRWGVIRQDTDIVIEGFPRSGNTFASTAFRIAQNRPVKLAYRLHAPIQLIMAAKMNIPAIVLIRNPEDVILSWVIHRPYITVKQALRGYINFYECITPYLSDFIIADFETVTSDFGKIIGKVNEKFNTNFAEFIHIKENENRCFEVINAFYQRAGDGKIPEQIVARPSEYRKQYKQQIRSQFYTEELADIRQKAFQIYRVFINLGYS